MYIEKTQYTSKKIVKKFSIKVECQKNCTIKNKKNHTIVRQKSTVKIKYTNTTA